MKTIKYAIGVLLLLISYCINSQDIKGLVMNESNKPLEAAYIYNLNSKSHAHSLENGSFILKETMSGDSIKVGLLGYKTNVIVLNDKNLESPLKLVLSEETFQLEELIITDALDASSSIMRLDLSTSPVNSSQDVLRKVPGLIIGQHAGGGKAEQIFLRGFDVDHGTDVAISVDGMPVNMVSHAHGQGYSDLHFLIPETVQKIDFGKGPYYANKGDFNTAGYVDFSTKNYLEESTISVSVGQFNSLRTLGMFDLLKSQKNQNAYLAMEYIATDGPFESSQNFNRLNVFGKYVMFSPNNDKLAVTLSNFSSRWDASGQIPQREVDNGTISRFGAIDDTEGGFTSRTNANVEFTKQISDRTYLKSNAFYTYYDFELYSNFTFFLEDPNNGDQIRQKEDRNIYGFNTILTHNTFFNTIPVHLNAGLSLRQDVTTDTELSKTLNRKTTLENIQLGDIDQTNMSAFLNSSFEIGNFRIEPGLRLDYFKFLYNDLLQETFETKAEIATAVNPKLNFYWDAKDNLQVYFKSGIGFHSNDTRVVVRNEGRDILPRAYGTDLGLLYKPFPKMVLNVATWYLFLEQEFVYVGDAGIVEPSGKTERFGLDFGTRYQFNDWLFFDTDLTYTKAKSLEDNSGENFIPLAPDFTMSGGLSVANLNGFSGGIKYRYLDARPANEDNSIVAEGYFVTDMNLNYTFKDITLGIVIENLFDTEWNETQFATESRLQNEASSVEEIHFTPGTPFYVRGTVSYRF